MSLGVTLASIRVVDELAMHQLGLGLARLLDAGDMVLLTGPLGGKHLVIRHHVPCSPCFKRECPFGHYDCMTKIQPARVAQAVLSLA